MLVIPNKITVALSAIMALTGCALPRPAIESDPLPLTPIRAPNPQATVGTDDRDFLVQTEVQPFFIAAELESSEPLPDIRLSGISFSTSSIYEVMRTLLSNTGLSYSINGDHVGSQIQRRSISAVNVSGSLKNILDGLSNTLGVYYSYRNGVINISPDRQYVLPLPPVDEAMESLSPMLKTLGATDIYLDKPGRMITFRAPKPSYEKINSYLEYVRSTKQLIVYDAHVWEVILNDANNTGIQWNRFSWTPSGSAAFNVTGGSPGSPSGLGLAAVYSNSKVAIDVLASFLQSQGNLKTVSQPKLTLISGGKAVFRVGNTTNYVSQIGTTVANNATNTTVQTAQVMSGLDLVLSGDISDGTVFTDVKLKLNDLQRFNTFTALGTQLSLPQTANRDVETKIRCRPGDTIMLAGINIEKNSQDVSGLPSGGNSILPTLADRSVQRSELVIVLKPRIIRFGKVPPTSAMEPAPAQDAPLTKEVEPNV